MKQFLIALVILLIAAFVITGCGQATTTVPAKTQPPAPATTQAPASATTQPPAVATKPPAAATTQPPAAATTPPPAPATTPAPAPTPQIIKGGTLNILAPNGPTVLGYFPDMWVGDEIAMLPVVERLMDYDDNREIVPWLAESWSVAQDGKSITFKIRKNITFTDGSPLDADSVKWNLQLGVDTKRMQFANRVTSIEIVDSSTVKVNITAYNNQLIHGMGWYPMYSKKAFETNGKEWCRTNPVTTGPFMVKDYKRDDRMTLVKNPNYWKPGKPYLDSIVVRYVPDAATASAIMQKKEADRWSASPQYQKELEAKGFVRQSNPVYGSPSGLLPNNKDASSPFRNLKVREALEYAIDKPAIAGALGYGYSKALWGPYPPGTWGAITEPKRPYNVAKAKQLLAEAGYPNGIKIKILAQTTATDTVAALKGYLDEAGFTTDPDLADFARYAGSVWSSGWPATTVVLYGWGVDPNTLMSFNRHWGPEPMSDPKSFERPAEFIAMFQDALTKMAVNDQIAVTQKLGQYMVDNALVIPLTYTPSAIMLQPYVRTSYLKQMLVSWHAEDDWLDKR